MSILSPRSLIGAVGAVCLLVAALVVSVAMNLPWSGLTIALDGEGLVVAAVDPQGPNGGRVPVGWRIEAFGAGDREIAAHPALVIEEPDLLPDYAAYNALMAEQAMLAGAAAAGTLSAVGAEGERRALAFAQRPVGALPWLFWLQLAFGIGGALTGAVVWGARAGDPAARLYAMTGFGYLIFAPAAAIYSTRELIIDGELFRLLSMVNHFGALFFTASLSALLWHYPLRLGRFPMGALCYGGALLGWIGDTWQWIDTTAWFHFSVLGVFALSAVFAVAQWWATRRRPADRAALRWFLVSIYLATGLFAGVIIVPAALGLAPVASQGGMFGAFLIMYWGLALGVVRYRLFQLEQWWYLIVGWFLGGLAVVVLDVVLLAFLKVPDLLGLTIAVAVVGWLYFPLRQWLWNRVGRKRARSIDNWLPEILPLLVSEGVSGEQEAALRARWPEALERVFRPLAIQRREGALATARIADNGMALDVPDVREPSEHLRLVGADGARRLYTADDLRTLAVLDELFGLALNILGARDQGARQERSRIRRDIHDDIGARLLTLLHCCDGERQAMVRDVLQSARMLVQTLDLSECDFAALVQAWHGEITQRCAAAGVALEWRRLGSADGVLSARQNANITRILREAVSNGLRHGRAASLQVAMGRVGGELMFTIANDGVEADQEAWGVGSGRRIMTERAQELGGRITWAVEGGVCTVTLTVPMGEAGPAAVQAERPLAGLRSSALAS